MEKMCIRDSDATAYRIAPDSFTAGTLRRFLSRHGGGNIRACDVLSVPNGRTGQPFCGCGAVEPVHGPFDYPAGRGDVETHPAASLLAEHRSLVDTESCPVDQQAVRLLVGHGPFPKIEPHQVGACLLYTSRRNRFRRESRLIRAGFFRFEKSGKVSFSVHLGRINIKKARKNNFFTRLSPDG